MCVRVCGASGDVILVSHAGVCAHREGSRLPRVAFLKKASKVPGRCSFAESPKSCYLCTPQREREGEEGGVSRCVLASQEQNLRTDIMF